jgi:hypothetical protein
MLCGRLIPRRHSTLRFCVVYPYYPAFAPAAKVETPNIVENPTCAAAQDCIVVK